MGSGRDGWREGGWLSCERSRMGSGRDGWMENLGCPLRLQPTVPPVRLFEGLIEIKWEVGCEEAARFGGFVFLIGGFT